MAMIFVRQDGSGGAFTTINDAIAAADAGDTIVVGDGDYAENVRIDKTITLVSENGRGATTITGQQASPGQGAVEILAGVDGVQLGDVNQGFTIVGVDGTPGSERAAVYLTGAHDGLVIQGNDIVANGDVGLLSEFNQPITDALIDSNVFSGQSFTGAPGIGDQFTVPNVPRPLVFLGTNNGSTDSSNITFTNNDVTGTAGGFTFPGGLPSGNTLVNIDAADSTISGNVFTGYTTGSGAQLRSREENTDITGNSFSNDGGGNIGTIVLNDGVPGDVSGNQITFGDGDSRIFASLGNDAIDGGLGTDTYDLSAAGAGGGFVDLGSGLSFSTATGIDTLQNIENVKGSAGADGLYGDAGDNVFEATAGSDVIDGRGGSDTFDASAATASVTVDLDEDSGSASGAFTAQLDNVENATGGSGADSFTGSSAANTLIGNGGADSFDGLGAGDVVDGGDDIDSASFDGAFGGVGGYTVTAGDEPGEILVTSADGDVTSLTGVEQLGFGDGQAVLIVGEGGFETIQDAVDAAGPDTTILVASGTYVEQVDIDGKANLTIKALGDGPVTIQAPADVIETSLSSSGRETHAVVTVENSTNVVIEGVTVDGDGRANTVDEGAGAGQAQYVGVFYRNASGGLEDVDVTGVRDPYDNGNISGIQRGVGIQVDNDVPAGSDPLLAFFMNGGSISDFQKNATVFNRADLTVTGVAITGGGAQPIIAQNGIQVLNSTGEISGNTITDIGYSGPAFAYSSLILAYGNTDLDITGNTLTGTNGVDPASKVIGVYVLDFGDPAFVNSGGSITGNVISFVDEGIDVVGVFTGEDVVIGDNTITDVDPADQFSGGVFFDPDDASTVSFIVEGSDLNDTLDGAAGTDSLSGGGDADLIFGRDGNDTLEGGAGSDTIDGGAGSDSLVGGGGDDTYIVDDASDQIVEDGSGGQDSVVSSVDHTLADNVENLTLTDAGSDTQDFEDFDLGAITNGENGWTVLSPGGDQGVVDLPGVGQVFKISSDPHSGGFSGPYSPDFGPAAGEPGTTAEGDVHILKFRLKPVSDVADNSRLEVDIGTEVGTDRNNFMAIESIAGQGLRIAVADPLLSGDFDTGAGLNDFSAFTGNRTLVSGLDPAAWHDIELRVTYLDGADNDVIEVYVDGALVGTTTTFENFRDALGGSHDDNAEANQSNRIFFRPTAGPGGVGAPQDGPGGQNQGFYFDDITNTITSNINGTGNAIANTITGNAGDNTLSGLGGDDSLNGGLGNDTLIGGAGNDTITGGAGNDTANVDVSTGGADVVDLGAGDDVVNVEGAAEVRVTFTSAEVGNGSPNDSSAVAPRDGGLAVRLQAENGTGNPTGDVGRYDDEGVSFVAAPGTKFDVRDLISGAQRGNLFDVVTLGTAAGDTIVAGVVIPSTPLNYYINGGMGDDDITGDVGRDFLVGGAGNDTLRGGLGADSFIGGGGDDSILGGAGDDVVIHNITTDGADQIDLGADLDVVNVNATTATQVRLTFTSAEVGNSNANDSGTMANQDGGLAIRMQAENGSDGLTGPVSRLDDEGVSFVAGSGVTFDVRDLVSGAARGDAFEVVTFGTAAGEILTAAQNTRPYYINGGMGNDTITGGVANDFLVGGAGNDVLRGDNGDDSFIGGGGDDDIETGRGADTVIHNVTTDGADSIVLRGDSDTLTVNASAPTQVRLTFTSSEVGNGFDTDSGTLANQDGGLAVRMQAENGSDGLTGPITRVDDEGVTFVAGSGVTFDVRDLVSGAARGDQFQVVKLGTESGNKLSADGRATYINAGMGDDKVFGGSANDFLVGGVGKDLLDGGAGADSMIGGGGADSFRFTSPLGTGNVDTILDFAAADDTITLKGNVFRNIGKGAVDAGEFVVGTAAADGDDRIIYNATTGSLLYDRDGSGTNFAAVEFAKLTPGLVLTEDDFRVL